MKKVALALATAVLWGTPTLAAETITECDKLAAHPSDPDKISPGLHDNQMNYAAAQSACEAAVAKDPNNRRLRYQLGRSYFYDKKFDKGMPHVEYAANAGSQQAQFVLGYIIDTGQAGQAKDACKVEDLWFKSASQGRMAAEVSYPHHVVRGMFKGCKQQASNDVMQTWLDNAKKQASGYYERMLVSMVAEEFNAYKSKK